MDCLSGLQIHSHGIWLRRGCLPRWVFSLIHRPGGYVDVHLLGFLYAATLTSPDLSYGLSLNQRYSLPCQLAKDSGHQDLIKRIRDQFADIFEKSDQSIYVYLDDVNKACNKRFASLLGYGSPGEWAAVKENFPEEFVSSGDRERLVSAYQNAMNNLVGSTMPIRWKKKGGGEISTTTILVPISLDGHRMALHFITPS